MTLPGVITLYILFTVLPSLTGDELGQLYVFVGIAAAVISTIIWTVYWLMDADDFFEFLMLGFLTAICVGPVVGFLWPLAVPAGLLWWLFRAEKDHHR